MYHLVYSDLHIESVSNVFPETMNCILFIAVIRCNHFVWGYFFGYVIIPIHAFTITNASTNKHNFLKPKETYSGGQLTSFGHNMNIIHNSHFPAVFCLFAK